MATRIIRSILQRTLGWLFKNDVDFKWKGWTETVLSLSNLSLDCDEINRRYGRDLPVTVLEGYVGRLHIKIHPFSLKSSPVVVEIDDLVVVCRPKRGDHTDAPPRRRGEDEDDADAVMEAERELMWQAKLQEVAGLRALEDEARAATTPAAAAAVAKKRKKAEEAAAKAAKGKHGKGAAGLVPKKDSYFKRLLMSVLQNLRVVVRSVHVRLEDDISTVHQRSAYGVVLQELRLDSLDAVIEARRALSAALDGAMGGSGSGSATRNGSDMVLGTVGAEGAINKALLIQGLAMYWVTHVRDQPRRRHKKTTKAKTKAKAQATRESGSSSSVDQLSGSQEEDDRDDDITGGGFFVTARHDIALVAREALSAATPSQAELEAAAANFNTRMGEVRR